MLFRVSILSLFTIAGFCANEAPNIQAFALPLLSKNASKKEWQQFAQIGGCYYPIPENLPPYIDESWAEAYEVKHLNEAYVGHSSQLTQQQRCRSLANDRWSMLRPKTQAL